MIDKYAGWSGVPLRKGTQQKPRKTVSFSGSRKSTRKAGRGPRPTHLVRLGSRPVQSVQWSGVGGRSYFWFANFPSSATAVWSVNWTFPQWCHGSIFVDRPHDGFVQGIQFSTAGPSENVDPSTLSGVPEARLRPCAIFYTALQRVTEATNGAQAGREYGILQYSMPGCRAELNVSSAMLRATLAYKEPFGFTGEEESVFSIPFDGDWGTAPTA